MTDTNSLSDVAADFRRHFDQYYLGVIPRLLTEEGMFLAFVTMLSALESLAGVYSPDQGAGDRFRAFVATYFPDPYRPHTDQLWQFRNRMVHSFNPAPLLIVCHQSRMHLCEADGKHILNAEDLYADVVTASRAYFADLYSNQRLQDLFAKRVASDDGGRPTVVKVLEVIGKNGPAV